MAARNRHDRPRSPQAADGYRARPGLRAGNIAEHPSLRAAASQHVAKEDMPETDQLSFDDALEWLEARRGKLLRAYVGSSYPSARSATRAVLEGTLGAVGMREDPGHGGRARVLHQSGCSDGSNVASGVAPAAGWRDSHDSRGPRARARNQARRRRRPSAMSL